MEPQETPKQQSSFDGCIVDELSLTDGEESSTTSWLGDVKDSSDDVREKKRFRECAATK